MTSEHDFRDPVSIGGACDELFGVPAHAPRRWTLQVCAAFAVLALSLLPEPAQAQPRDPANEAPVETAPAGTNGSVTPSNRGFRANPSPVNPSPANPPQVTATSSTPDEIHVTLRYQVPHDCPSRAEFERQLLGRTSHLRVSPENGESPLLTLDVSARPADDGRVIGSARILLGQSVRDEREFLGRTCLEVTRAAALSIAFALENIEIRTPEPEPPPEPPPPEPEPLPPPAAPPPGALFDAGIAPIAANVLERPWFAGASVWLGGRLTGAVRSAAQLGVVAATSGAFDDEPSSFRWLVADLQLCPQTWGTELRLALCGHALAGILQAEGGGIEFPREVTRSWLGVGPVLRVSAWFSDNTGIVASTSANAALTKRSFLFEHPRVLVASGADVVWLFSVGIEHTIGGT